LEEKNTRSDKKSEKKNRKEGKKKRDLLGVYLTKSEPGKGEWGGEKKTPAVSKK